MGRRRVRRDSSAARRRLGREQGNADFNDIRTLYDPPWGFVAPANADPAGLTADGELWAPRYFGYDFDFGLRIARIH